MKATSKLLSGGYSHAIIVVLALAATTWRNSVRGDELSNWHWRNPSPFANTLRSVCFGQGKFVGVGDGGVIHVSLDGSIWDDGRRPVNSTLHKVIYANGRFAAVGDDGAILTSTNGYNWTQHSYGATNTLFAIAFHNGRFIACGVNGKLATSSDGVAWGSGSVGTNNHTWMTAGNGLFMVPGPGMELYLSQDGLVWWATTIEAPGGFNYYGPVLHRAAFGNGFFVASIYTSTPDPYTGHTYWPCERFYTSTDGTNWSAGAVLFADSGYNGKSPRFLTFANSSFFEIVQSIQISPDGNTLSRVGVPEGASDAMDLSYGNGHYVLLGTSGKSWSSSDGTNWNANPFGGFRTTVRGLTRGATSYYAVSQGAASWNSIWGNVHAGVPILTSVDGITFNELPGSPSVAYNAIAFDGSNYVAVGEQAALYTSTNGVDWVQRNSNANQHLLALTRAPARWLAAGRGGAIITSPNGTVWTLRSSGTANTLRGLAFGNGVYVAVGDSGTIVSSTDSSLWEVQDSGTTAALRGVQFISGQFYAVGDAGTIVRSPDGAAWQNVPSGTQGNLYSITAGNGHFLLSGYQVKFSDFTDPQNPGYYYWATLNVLLHSTNGLNWEDITTKIPDGIAMENVTFLSGSFWVYGPGGSMLQSDTADGRPILSGAMSPGNEAFEIKLILNVPQTFRIEVCTNVASAWQQVASVTNPVPPYTWLDTNVVTSALRFYRVATP